MVPVIESDGAFIYKMNEIGETLENVWVFFHMK